MTAKSTRDTTILTTPDGQTVEIKPIRESRIDLTDALKAAYVGQMFRIVEDDIAIEMQVIDVKKITP